MQKIETYQDLVNRNIGFITGEQQEKLRNSCVAVFGVGGLGAVAAEVLCRCGIGRMKIIEHGIFEPTNLNRQIFCFRSTLDKRKREVTELFLKDINPDIEIELYEKEDTKNIKEILEATDAVILAVDKVRACIIISRQARTRGIPLIESWAIPYGNVRVFTKDTLSLEEAYRLQSIGKKIEDISEAEFKEMDLVMLNYLTGFVEDIMSFYSAHAMERVRQRENPTFAPCVWMNGALMSLEAIKVLLNWGAISLAPNFALYDPFFHRIPKQQV